ncbi:hypothetical protein GGR52DRAFT_241652 [Hypoxylon sp. FL1284]|nr:hypothetical protein GGR52DRAFT_241652 [Hypoxylon sp. FL1284]
MLVYLTDQSLSASPLRQLQDSMAPSSASFDYRSQIIDNCEFFVAKYDIVSVITVRDPKGLYRAYAIRSNQDSRDVLLSSEPNDVVLKAVASLHAKSCEAAHHYIAANGFAHPPDLKRRSSSRFDEEDERGDDDDTASFVSGHSASSTAALSYWGASSDSEATATPVSCAADPDPGPGSDPHAACCCGVSSHDERGNDGNTSRRRCSKPSAAGCGRQHAREPVVSGFSMDAYDSENERYRQQQPQHHQHQPPPPPPPPPRARLLSPVRSASATTTSTNIGSSSSRPPPPPPGWTGPPVMPPLPQQQPPHMRAIPIPTSQPPQQPQQHTGPRLFQPHHHHSHHHTTTTLSPGRFDVPPPLRPLEGFVHHIPATTVAQQPNTAAPVGATGPGLASAGGGLRPFVFSPARGNGNGSGNLNGNGNGNPTALPFESISPGLFGGGNLWHRNSAGSLATTITPPQQQNTPPKPVNNNINSNLPPPPPPPPPQYSQLPRHAQHQQRTYDVRLAIRCGRGERRVLECVRPSIRALQEAAVAYVRAHTAAFGLPSSPAVSTSTSGTVVHNADGTATGQRLPLRARVRTMCIGDDDDACDVSAYPGDDLSRLLSTAQGVPRFVVQVDVEDGFATAAASA